MRYQNCLIVAISLALGCDRPSSPVPSVKPVVMTGNGLGSSAGGPGSFVEPVASVATGYVKAELPEAAFAPQGGGGCGGGDLTINIAGCRFQEANGNFTLYKSPRNPCGWSSGGYQQSNGVELGDKCWWLNGNSNGGQSRLSFGGDPHFLRADYIATGVSGPGTYYLYGSVGGPWPATITVN